MSSFILTLTVIGFQLCVQHAHAQTSANLLTDPGFESNSLDVSIAGVFAGTQNVWGPENSNIVGTTGTISPIETRMLQMFNAGGGATQTFQLVAVPTAFESGIDAGIATFDLSAFFNVMASVPNAIGAVEIEFLGSDGLLSLGSLSNNSNSLGANGLDVDPLTWENVLLDNGAIPQMTRFFRTQVLYSNVALTGGNTGFVDNAVLQISVVPEPSSFALAAFGLLGIGCRRRKRA